MKLSIKDRVIILNTVLPGYATREKMKNLVIPITKKLALPQEDAKEVQVKQIQDGSSSVEFTKEAVVDKNFDLTIEEISYLCERVKLIDQNGMFSIDTIETYDKILNEDSPEDSEDS